MRIADRRILLFSLLVLYGVSRVLQLFAGRMPNLVIVVFHVVPPALFALVHGGRVYRWRGILVFAALCLGVGSFFELLSLRTRFPFGDYFFTGLMGPKVFGLPVLLALAYVGMGYVSWAVALAILGRENRPLTGKWVVLVPLVASFAMMTWDLSMEAVWADVDHGWVWRNGGPYFGVPTGNFLGWLLTAYLFYRLFAVYLQGRTTVAVSTREWLPAIWFYGVSAVGNLLVVAPAWMGSVFVDGAGRRWKIASVLLACRLVSVLVMLPLGLIAWYRIRGVKLSS